MTPHDLYRAGAPFGPGGGARLFVVDTSPDSLTLAAGAHEIYNGGDELAYVRLGTAISIPTDKGDEVSSQTVIPPRGLTVIVVGVDTALHAITALSSTTLHLTRKAAI